MKDPAFLFYSNDFLSGTMLMTDEEIGQYIKLLCLQHQKGHLKEKDMLNICKTYNEEIFSKFKKDEEGNFFNERLEEEIIRRKKYSESRRNNRNKVDNSNTNVYLIQDCNTGLIKIGSSNNPERRLLELKNQYKNDNLILIAYVENVEQKLETNLHNKYKKQNETNEWFNLSSEDIEEIINTNHMKRHINNHMNSHMNNHMNVHMETEATTTTENINNININNKNINNKNIKNKNIKKDIDKEKLEDKLQKRFIECINSTNLNAINECISFLEDLPFEVIEIALTKASDVNGSWKYAKKILNDWHSCGIDTVEKVEAEELNFKNKNKQNEETEEEKKQRKIKELEDYIKNGNK